MTLRLIGREQNKNIRTKSGLPIGAQGWKVEVAYAAWIHLFECPGKGQRKSYGERKNGTEQGLKNRQNMIT